MFDAILTTGGGVGVDGGGGISPPVSYPSYGMHAPDGGGDYNSVTLTANYTETVTVTGAFGTGDFILQGGTINQPTTGTDITVTGAAADTPDNDQYLGGLPANFYWTGGVLNNTSQLSNLNVTGAAALIAPAGTSALHNGDQFNFLNGAQAIFMPGEEYFDNGAGIYVGSLCGVEVRPTSSATVTHSSNVSFETGTIEVAAGGFYTVNGTNDFAATTPATYNAKMPFVNNGGTVKVQGGSTLSVRGYTGGNLPAEDAYTQTSGETQIENGSTLRVRNRDRTTGTETSGRVVISGGLFSTRHHSLLQANQQIATVTGSFLMNGATASLIIGYDGGGTVSEVFEVTGVVVWSAGTYHPFVNASSTAASLWLADMDFGVGANAKITPEPIGTPTNPQTWKIMESKIGITGQMPKVTGWTLLAPNPATEWDLKKN